MGILTAHQIRTCVPNETYQWLRIDDHSKNAGLWLFIAMLRILHGARRMASFRPANRTHTTNQAASFDKSKDPEEFTNCLTGNHPRNPEISQMVTVLSKLCIHQLISSLDSSNNPSFCFIIVLQGPDRRWKLHLKTSRSKVFSAYAK